MESCSLQIEYSACTKERCPVAHIISPRKNYINLLRTTRRRTVIRMWVKMMMTSGTKTLVLRLIGGGAGRIRDKGARPATLRVMGIIGNSWINPRCAEQRRHKSISCSRRDRRWRWTWTGQDRTGHYMGYVKSDQIMSRGGMIDHSVCYINNMFYLCNTPQRYLDWRSGEGVLHTYPSNYHPSLYVWGDL